MSSSGDDRPRSGDGGSSRRDARTDERERPRTVRDWLGWFWTVERGGAAVLREFLISAGAVLLVGLLLFSVSGVWPPMVAIESGSMEPNMKANDLVFITDNDRFVPDAAHADTGVVTAETGAETGYRTFNGPGDVIVYEPNGSDRQVPIIHRAHFWVDEGENWYDKANPDHVGNADNCEELRNCPAPNAGFITKGDNEVTNERYDQARGLSGPVKEEWVIGTAEIRVPWLGWVRLQLAELATVTGPGMTIEPATELPAAEPPTTWTGANPPADRITPAV